MASLAHIHPDAYFARLRPTAYEVAQDIAVRLARMTGDHTRVSAKYSGGGRYYVYRYTGSRWVRA